MILGSFINMRTLKLVLIAELRPVPDVRLAGQEDNVIGHTGSAG
jgi:hypothetical protein